MARLKPYERLVEDDAGENLLLNFIERDLKKRPTFQGRVDMVITNRGPFLSGAYDAVEVEWFGRTYRIQVEEV